VSIKDGKIRADQLMLPLDHIRILDLTRLIPGSYCTLLLADFGADVIKIEEPPVGDYERQIPPFIKGIASRFLQLNRNKRSLAVDLKKEDGKTVFKKLLKKADVVIESFRPGVMENLGLGYNVLSELNPRIIFCSISGFGHTGPWKHMVAHDLNILGIGGFLDLNRTSEGVPVIPGIQVVDIATGMFSAISILLSILARQKTGKGQFVDISMLDALISLVFDSARYYFTENRLPVPGGERLSGGLPNYNIYKTKDGRYLTVAALETKFKNKLLEILGCPDLIDRGDAMTSLSVTAEQRSKMGSFLGEIFETKTLKEWIDILGPLNVCVAPVNNMKEALDNAHLYEREMVIETTHPLLGSIKQIGTPVKLLDNPGKIGGYAPALGEHNEQILMELGYSQLECDLFLDSGVISREES